jgi:hypothetical protein
MCYLELFGGAAMSTLRALGLVRIIPVVVAIIGCEDVGSSRNEPHPDMRQNIDALVARAVRAPHLPGVANCRFSHLCFSLSVGLAFPLPQRAVVGEAVVGIGAVADDDVVEQLYFKQLASVPDTLGCRSVFTARI